MLDVKEHDLKLMRDELIRLYGKDIAKKIMLEHKDNLFTGKQSVAYSLGKRSLKFFSLYYLQDMFIGEGKAELSSTHYESWEELTDVFNGTGYKKRNYLFPRGFGKTAILSTPTVIWAHCYEHSKLTVLGSAIKDTSTAFMMSIKEGFSKPRIVETFGELVNDELINNTEKLELANNSMIMVASTRTTLRGINYKSNRINLLILDDYQSETNTTTKEAMDSHWDLFQRNALPAVEKHKHWILGFGTTQKPGDFYNRLENDPSFKTFRRPALPTLDMFENEHWQEFKRILLQEEDGLIKAHEYYNKNKSIMEYDRIWNYFDCVNMAILYFTDEAAFRQEYQLEFADTENKKFVNIVYEDIEDDAAKVLVVDPATSSKSSSDYSAFVVGGYEDNIVKVKDGIIDRLDFDQYIGTMIKLLKKYPTIDTIIVEKQTYNSADVTAAKNVIQRDMELYYRHFNWINEHQSKNKETKILSIVGEVNRGMVKFDNSLKDSAAIEQLSDFTSTTSSKHDDFPDALSELVIHLKEDNLQDNVLQVYDMSLMF